MRFKSVYSYIIICVPFQSYQSMDISIDMIKAFHAAGECRRPVITHFVKNVNILEFHGHIWNHHEKYIQQSTNMPGIGSLIREIDITISGIRERKTHFC